MPTMLVVDDQQDLCDILARYFSARGFEVSSAFSGEEALHRMEARPPEVVLLDILLPGISGLEVLKRVRRAFPGTRVVMVTGTDRSDWRAEAKLFGACGFVTKPFQLSDNTWSAVFASGAA